MLFVFSNVAPWQPVDGHNATHCPDLCQLSEFDNPSWQGELEETTFLSINYVALTCSSIAQFNMDIIKLEMSWCTVYSFLWSFGFIVWQNNNGLISKTKIWFCQRTRYYHTVHLQNFLRSSQTGRKFNLTIQYIQYSLNYRENLNKRTFTFTPNNI